MAIETTIVKVLKTYRGGSIVIGIGPLLSKLKKRKLYAATRGALVFLISFAVNVAQIKQNKIKQTKNNKKTKHIDIL